MRLGGIWGELQISVEHRLATWLVAFPLKVYRHEFRVNFSKRLGVIDLEAPPFFGRVVLVENSEIQSLFFVRSASAPVLKRACTFGSWLLVQVIGVKDKGFTLGIKYASG